MNRVFRRVVPPPIEIEMVLVHLNLSSKSLKPMKKVFTSILPFVAVAVLVFIFVGIKPGTTLTNAIKEHQKDPRPLPIVVPPHGQIP